MIGATEAQPAAESGVGEKIRVLFTDTGVVEEMELDDYLIGVVSAEMPASFEAEALKAQAVAARSFALYHREHGASGHENADVCTDSTHCKAYRTREASFAQWGAEAETYYAKISDAVRATHDEVVSYGGDVALAVFHAASGGQTQNAVDVWGGDYPYLRSVPSSGEEQYRNYHSTVTVPFSDFAEKIHTAAPEVTVTSPDEIGLPTYSEGGSVATVIIGGHSFRGTELRTLFDLRSAVFTMEVNGDSVTFLVTGYGHGVGMSQYGANAMAQGGSDYRQILAHYYSGTTVEKISIS